MIKFKLSALVAVFGVFALCFSGAARAEFNIAVVDVDYVLSQSLAAKSLQKQVDDKKKSFLNEVKAEEKDLISKQESIEKEKDKLSREELIAKAREFEEKRLEARKKIQTKKSKLDEAYAKAMNKITKAVYEVCQEIADEKKYDLVITRQNIIVGNMSLDITKDVAERMNEKLKKVTLKVD